MVSFYWVDMEIGRCAGDFLDTLYHGECTCREIDSITTKEISLLRFFTPCKDEIE
jgi:hypothetical protein